MYFGGFGGPLRQLIFTFYKSLYKTWGGFIWFGFIELKKEVKKKNRKQNVFTSRINSRLTRIGHGSTVTIG